MHALGSALLKSGEVLCMVGRLGLDASLSGDLAQLSYKNPGLIQSLLYVPINLRLAFDGAFLLVHFPLPFCSKWLISQRRAF